MKRIYFDNAATTPLDKRVLRAIKPFLKQKYGNPSSVHKEGKETKMAIEKARIQVAKVLNCSSSEIYFTSGASESNAIIANSGNVVVSSHQNHDSIELWLDKNKKNNTKIYFYSVINNETGKYIRASELKKYKYIHADLTQAIGKKRIDLQKDTNITSASFSAHKFGGLKGTGVLFIRENCSMDINPLILGHQENEIRGGTENVLGIVSLGKAIELAEKDRFKNHIRINQIANYIYNNLTIEKKYKPQKMTCNNGIINLTFKHLNAQSAVQILDKYGIAVSAGSACNSNSDEPSKILIDEGYSIDEANKTIRISLGKQNTLREAKRFIKVLKKIIDKYD